MSFLFCENTLLYTFLLIFWNSIFGKKKCKGCVIFPFDTTGGAVLEDGDGTNLAQAYNPKTCVWTEVAAMQIARSGSAACILKGKIYVIGEYGGLYFIISLSFIL